MKSEQTATQPKPYHHGDLRRTLLDVAHAEVSAKGAAAVSMASLARAAGVSQPAPYRHFADRDALLAELAVQGFAAFTAALLAAAEANDGDSIRAMALAYVTFGEQNVELYRLMFASRLVPLAAPDSALAIAADAGFAPLLAAVAKRCPGPSAQAAATGIWALVHGLVMLKADGFIEGLLKDHLPERLL